MDMYWDTPVQVFHSVPLTPSHAVCLDIRWFKKGAVCEICSLLDIPSSTYDGNR